MNARRILRRFLGIIRRNDEPQQTEPDQVTESLQQRTLERVSRARSELERLRMETEIERRAAVLQAQADVILRYPYRRRGEGMEVDREP